MSGNRVNGVFMKQAGLSLVELMIALLLSTLLTLGIFTMYMDSTETSRISRSLARVQESGRIALDIMAEDLRMLGFLGCSYPLQDLRPSFVASNLDENFFASGIRGAVVGEEDWANIVGDFGVAALAGNAVAGSDVFQLRYANGPGLSLDQDMAAPGSVISTGSDEAVTRFRIGGDALITNCATADMFTVGDPDGFDDNEINHQALSTTYPEGARVMQFRTITYWVGDTGRTDQNGNAIFALYQNGLEAVSGVERMQVLFGVREEDQVRFLTADNITDDQWNDIEAAQVGLLVSDEQAVMQEADAKQYVLPGLTVDPAGTAGAAATYPADGRLRTTFTMTVKVRNQIDQ